MKLNGSDSSYKAVTRRYVSDLFCLVISAFAASVFYFSVEGTRVALEHEQFIRYAWVPVTLMFLSGILLVTSLFRILSRMANRPAEDE